MCAVLVWFTSSVCGCFFFFNDTATTEIYTLSLHDALPISARRRAARRAPRHARGGEGRLLGRAGRHPAPGRIRVGDRKSTRLNSSHSQISYAVFCLKKKKKQTASSACRTTYAASRAKASST